jgi:hypothetical protein
MSHPVSKDPIVRLELQRTDKQIYKENMEDLLVHISARGRHDTHSVQVDPSCAVNPPWKQYIRGVDKEWIFKQYGGSSWKDTDNRAKVIKGEIFGAFDMKKERGGKLATWKEYRALAGKVQKALIKLDNINLRRTK